MNTLITAFFFLYGLALGSFLNVVIYRLPLHLPIAKGRSMCTACKTSLKAWDLIPVLSFVFLKGRCRYCGESISFRYPLVELLTGLIFAMCHMFFGLTAKAVILCIFAFILIAAAFIDIDHRFIPDRFSIAIALLGIISAFADPSVSLQSRLAGAISAGGFMLAVSLITKGGIGGGDIKLFFASGLLLGLKLNVLSFMLGYFLAGICMIGPYMLKKLPKNYEVPMVPFFAAAFMFSVFWGNSIISWYLSLF